MGRSTYIIKFKGVKNDIRKTKARAYSKNCSYINSVATMGRNCFQMKKQMHRKKSQSFQYPLAPTVCKSNKEPSNEAQIWFEEFQVWRWDNKLIKI